MSEAALVYEKGLGTNDHKSYSIARYQNIACQHQPFTKSKFLAKREMY